MTVIETKSELEVKGQFYLLPIYARRLTCVMLLIRNCTSNNIYELKFSSNFEKNINKIRFDRVHAR